MSGAALALRKAVLARLAADAALGALLGGARIYDEPPRALPPPYVVLADCGSHEASGDETPVERHDVRLEVWSRQGGLSEALRISDRVVTLLDDSELALTGFRLAMLIWVSTDAGRIVEQDFRRATLTFRAATEPL